MLSKFKKQMWVAALCGAAGLAQAQAWPSKTITIVVPFPPGGTTDVLARAVSTKLSANLGQTVIVDNKPGAGATLGAAQVAKANADGYTLLMGAVHHTIATSVYKGLTYSFDKDFAPITTVAMVPNVVVVNANVPAKTIQELVSRARAEPGRINFGTGGVTQFADANGNVQVNQIQQDGFPVANAVDNNLATGWAIGNGLGMNQAAAFEIRGGVDAKDGVLLTFTLDQLRNMTAQTQVTRHDCVEGWSATADWTGIVLADLIRAVG